MTVPGHERPDAVPDSTAPELPLNQRELWALHKHSRPNKCLLDEQTDIQFLGLRSASDKSARGALLTQFPAAPAALGSVCIFGESTHCGSGSRPVPVPSPASAPSPLLRWPLGLPTRPVLPSSLAASSGREMSKQVGARDAPTPQSVLRPEPGGLLKTNDCSRASSSRKWGAEGLRRPCSRTRQEDRG